MKGSHMCSRVLPCSWDIINTIQRAYVRFGVYNRGLMQISSGSLLQIIGCAHGARNTDSHPTNLWADTTASC